MINLEITLPSVRVLAPHSDRYVITAAGQLAETDGVKVVVFRLYDTFELDVNYASALFSDNGEDVLIAHLKSADGSLISPTESAEESMIDILPSLKSATNSEIFCFPAKKIARVLSNDLFLSAYALLVLSNVEILICKVMNLALESEVVVVLIKKDSMTVISGSVDIETISDGILSVLKNDPSSIIRK